MPLCTKQGKKNFYREIVIIRQSHVLTSSWSIWEAVSMHMMVCIQKKAAIRELAVC